MNEITSEYIKKMIKEYEQKQHNEFSEGDMVEIEELMLGGLCGNNDRL